MLLAAPPVPRHCGFCSLDTPLGDHPSGARPSNRAWVECAIDRLDAGGVVAPTPPGARASLEPSYLHALVTPRVSFDYTTRHRARRQNTRPDDSAFDTFPRRPSNRVRPRDVRVWHFSEALDRRAKVCLSEKCGRTREWARVPALTPKRTLVPEFQRSAIDAFET
jgi:hypothetical protein